MLLKVDLNSYQDEQSILTMELWWPALLQKKRMMRYKKYLSGFLSAVIKIKLSDFGWDGEKLFQ